MAFIPISRADISFLAKGLCKDWKEGAGIAFHRRWDGAGIRYKQGRQSEVIKRSRRFVAS